MRACASRPVVSSCVNHLASSHTLFVRTDPQRGPVLLFALNPVAMDVAVADGRSKRVQPHVHRYKERRKGRSPMNIAFSYWRQLCDGQKPSFVMCYPNIGLLRSRVIVSREQKKTNYNNSNMACSSSIAIVCV